MFDPPASVYKGYSLSKDAEEYLSSVGMKNPLYCFGASDLREDVFGALTPCLFQVLCLHSVFASVLISLSW